MRLFAFLLSLILLAGMCACGEATPDATGEPTGSTEATEATESKVPVVSYNYPEIKEKLTWDAINAFPIKSADMTVEEMRDLCVDFFYFSKTALWIPDQNWEYIITNSGNPDSMTMGIVYGGMPYITNGGGSVYRLMDWIDEETGVMDMTEAIADPTIFGNQCSYGSHWGWARVINSATFSYTSALTHSNGFLRVGPYTYDDTQARFEEGVWDTKMIITQNGAEIMCQSYAQMKKADGLVLGGEGGHVMMCKTDPVVVYNNDGTVNAAESYVYILDQHAKWVEDTNESGDTFLHKNYINRKFTFNDLMMDGYIPFTFAEFLGTDPIEETEVTFNHSGATITPDQVNTGVVTANYSVSDIYAHVKDSSGNIVLTVASRSTKPTKELNFFRKVSSSEWSAYTDGNYTVEIVCQLGTGERPTIYTGKLVK